MPTRTPDEIRASIDENRQQLGVSLVRLRDEVHELTDWRARIARNQRQVSIGAAAAGVVIGGGIAGLSSLAFGGKRRRARRAA